MTKTPIPSAETETKPSRQTLPYRRIPPHYPVRPSPALLQRRKQQKTLQFQSQSRSRSKAKARSLLKSPTSTITTTTENLRAYWVIGTPKWLRQERVAPKWVDGGDAKGGRARTPTWMRARFMGWEELRAWRAEEERRERERMVVWEGGVSTYFEGEDFGDDEVGEEVEEEMREEEGKSKGCGMQ